MKRFINGSTLLNAVLSTLALSSVMGGFGLAEEPPGPTALPNQTAPPPAIAPIAERNLAISSVTPVFGKIDLRLRNNIGTQITLEAAGFSPNTLTSGQSVTLHSLPTPIIVKIARADGGSVKVRPIENASLGVLEVAIDEGNEDSGVMTIQPNGNVFIQERQPDE
jgi:hypothetical protein